MKWIGRCLRAIVQSACAIVLIFLFGGAIDMTLEVLSEDVIPAVQGGVAKGIRVYQWLVWMGVI